MADQRHNDHLILIWLTGGIFGLILWQFFQNRYKQTYRGGSHVRHVQGSSIFGASLDNSLGKVTPEHLLHFGPSMRPVDWTPHKVKYPVTPGFEMQRLIYGAPGAYNCTTPTSLRPWLFEPPAEEDY